MPVPFKEFKEFEALQSEYEQYRNFIYSVAVKIANSKDNRNEFEKAILKKIMVYKIYKASEMDNEDSEINNCELLELWNIHELLNIKNPFDLEFSEIVIKIIYARFPTNGFSEKIESIKNMLSFAR